MVGLDKFREAFAEYSDNYVVIGGTACDIVLQSTVMQPRVTHDIDMIIIVENMTPAFGERFWDFVNEAGYRPEKRKTPEGETPKYELYRFLDGKPGYPEMIELLSRHPEVLGEPKGRAIEPLPFDEDVSSLSAIIMDDDFYHFTIDNSTISDGIRHASPAALIALKARAYLNLLADKAEGRHVNSKDIKKHRSDVLKNVVAVEGAFVEAPSSIVQCVKDFIASIRQDYPTLLSPLASALGVGEDDIQGLVDQLEALFRVKE